MKKIVSLLLTAAMCCTLLAGCQSQPVSSPSPSATPTVSATPDATPTAAPQSYQAGTYTATAYGNISDITVEVTFSESAITDVKVTEQNETPALFGTVEETIPAAIVEHQSLAVDAVTGATNSSRAIVDAVADCVKQAGGDPEALKITIGKTAGADEEYTVDIAVIGLGASGFIAATNAADLGASVLALEKGSSVASANGIKVSGPFAVNTPVLEEINSTLTVDEVFNHVMEYSHWTPNAALMRKCLETSREAVTRLMDMGYNFQEANFRFETPFVGEKGGFHLIKNSLDERVALWEAEIEKTGVQVLYNTSGEELIMQDGKAVGVIGHKADGTKVTVNAEAVVIATGGYLGNEEMLAQYLGTSHVNVAAGGNSLCTGDGIQMAVAAGAGLDKTFGVCAAEYGGTNSLASRPAKQDKYDQNTAFKFGTYGCLLVDAQGRRFVNEGLQCDYPMSYGFEPLLRNSPYYAVVDAAYVEAMATQGLYEYTTARGANAENWFIGNYYKERILTNLYADIDEAIAEGWCYKADTIEELAEFFGLEYLPQTVAEYNQFCADGVDPEFGANPWYLSPVAEGPFYVTQNEVSGWSTFGGIRIDEDCRAMTSENEIIPGLYVIGTDAGSLFYTPYYDVPGFCYGLCVDSGMIASKHAVSYVKK